jgi:phenylacetate-CoA ligase
MLLGFPRLGDWQTRRELELLQAERLPETLLRARQAPFYRSRIPETAGSFTVADLRALPLTTKADLRAAYPFGLLAVPRERLETYHESSGTSGSPTASYFTAGDWLDVADRFTRSAVALKAADTLLVKTPYAMLTTGHQAHHAGQLVGATIVPADNRSLVTPYGRVVRMLRDLDVTVAWCLPSECLLWAAAARLAGLRPEADFPSLRAFWVAGEPLTDARRARIREVWRTPVFEDYGSTETGSLAGECPEGTLHLWADRFLAEVHDPATGAFAPEGSGQLVVTSLYREAMPLVRYHLGDTVDLGWGDCACGWPLPAVRVAGRAVGLAAGPAGPRRRIGQTELEEVVYSLPPDLDVWFWRARSTAAALEIEIEVAREREGAAVAALTDAVRERFAVPARVRPLPPGGLIPEAVLRELGEFGKPRTLFEEHEDWSKAVVYH